ncbi:hypothetical protein OKA04_09485 [Luteolibacter flavescens]|uniref:FecR protein domain-containing protein n=2 Tax=Luteolibacter flavescens TaxID=1859460 RepID=A0ABT3FP11_9BACT|nr:hypothetical protein [Luteolibacter flavescens]
MQDDAMNADFDILCAQYLDGTMDEVDRDRLAAILASDPAALDALRSQLVVSGALARLRPELSDERFLGAVLPHLGAMADEADDDFPARVRKTIRVQWWRRTTLAAAALIILAGTAIFLTTTLSRGPVVATRFHDDEKSSEVRMGERLVFDTGVTRMEFSNGAVVAIEAPAELSVRSGDEVVLEHGRLNAWCPETAHGFRVVTASATLTDLGTSFGVTAERDGTADFMVMDGKVEVQKDDEKRLIERGAALRARRGKRLSVVAFEPSGFRRTWPVASGIHSTRGEVVTAPPGTPEYLAALENDHRILVIPERRDLRLQAPLRADIVQPGIYESSRLLGTHDVRPGKGKRVRSYLLRYNPVGQMKSGEAKRFEGSVTFDRPVLGIITASRKLNRTDALLSKAPLPPLNAQDTELRGLERQQHPPHDRVELSADRRTITVTFFADQSIDEIRAITRDN